MAIGRPRIIQSPDEAWEKGQAYFNKCREEERPITITGLALALGLNGRQQLIDYANRVEFIDTIKTLKSIVENYAEERAFSTTAAGAIFILKNHGWSDKTEQDVNLQATHKVISWDAQ
jgi:hypothetical protein